MSSCPVDSDSICRIIDKFQLEMFGFYAQNGKKHSMGLARVSVMQSFPTALVFLQKMQRNYAAPIYELMQNVVFAADLCTISNPIRDVGRKHHFQRAL